MVNLFYLLHFLECGHFCINYVLKKEKKKRCVDYERIMMSFGLVKRVLSEYFSNVRCYLVDDLTKIDRRVVSLVKIRGKYWHYIVIEKVKNGYVYVYNPFFIGVRKIKIVKFIKKWENICCFYD